MKLPLPFDTEAEPFLQCMRCGREIPAAPPIGDYPQCEQKSDEHCLPQVIYKHLTADRVTQNTNRGSHESSNSLATPLLAPTHLRNRVGIHQLWLKNETVLPTGSWKDRVNHVHVTLATKWKYPTVAAISTGNHGISLAAHARRSSLHCRVLIHRDCPAFTRQLIEYFGAEVMPYDDAPYPQLRELMQQDNVYPAASLPFISGGKDNPIGIGNPFGTEGYKSIAVEIARQLKLNSQTWIVVPAGIGDGVFGIDKGFRELADAGLIDHRPRIVAVQGEGCASLVDAWQHGKQQIQPAANPHGMALSIREPQSGEHALRALRDSNGQAIAVSDEQIIEAMAMLADEGLLIEPASAATVAAVHAMRQPNHTDPIPADAQVVCILSGSGMKWAGADWFKHF